MGCAARGHLERTTTGLHAVDAPSDGKHLTSSPARARARADDAEVFAQDEAGVTEGAAVEKGEHALFTLGQERASLRVPALCLHPRREVLVVVLAFVEHAVELHHVEAVADAPRAIARTWR